MTVYDLIKTLEKFDPDANVKIVFNTANPMWAQTIEVKDAVEHDDGEVYIIEDCWGQLAWAPEGLIEE